MLQYDYFSTTAANDEVEPNGDFSGVISVLCLCKRRSGWSMMASIGHAAVRGRLKNEAGLQKNTTLSHQMEQYSTVFTIDSSGKFSSIVFASGDSDQIRQMKGSILHELEVAVPNGVETTTRLEEDGVASYTAAYKLLASGNPRGLTVSKTRQFPEGEVLQV